MFVKHQMRVSSERKPKIARKETAHTPAKRIIQNDKLESVTTRGLSIGHNSHKLANSVASVLYQKMCERD